jgi:hypothetical protein
VLTDTLQREVIHDALRRAGLTGQDQSLPRDVRVRHGRNGKGTMLHLYFNFSGQEQKFTYPYAFASDLLTGAKMEKGSNVSLRPWDLIIAAER